MDTNRPDIFGNVHKGIRKALFAWCIDLGRAGDDDEARAACRSATLEVLHFVEHHGENEDTLLLPLLEARAPAWHARIVAAHARIDAAIASLREPAEPSALHLRACAFTAQYLEHMNEEEMGLLPVLERVLSVPERIAFGRDSVSRTAPADQRMMLGHMLPAMPIAEVEALLAKLPEELARSLRHAAQEGRHAVP
jgi:hypothetical protein